MTDDDIVSRNREAALRHLIELVGLARYPAYTVDGAGWGEPGGRQPIVRVVMSAQGSDSESVTVAAAPLSRDHGHVSGGRCSGRVGAVVVGGDYQGLGIVRSLGRRSIPVHVIDDEASIARFSRFTTSFTRTADLANDERLVGALRALHRARRCDGWVVYPTRDETVAALARHRPQLTPLFRVPTPDWKTVRWTVDKRATYPLAQSLGIPVPRTWYVRSADELAGLEAEPPLVIKPAFRGRFLRETKAKAWRADSRSELRTLFHRAAGLVAESELMIQELVPGDGRDQYAYCAFFADGAALGSMVARRRRQHPAEFGRASTFVETVELPDLEEYSTRFLRHIDYYGLIELEYKLDRRDGQYKLLDVNARTWGYHTLGARAGVDFAYLLFADQVGHRPPTAARTCPGVRWARLVTDIPLGAAEIRKGRMAWRSYARSLRSFDEEAVFSRDDPLPWFAELALLPYLAAKRGF